jgi:ubiquinone/menaquinone biosynthesis C-methylase UbiE
MNASTTESRVERSPAEIYDECFVPALFERWGTVMCEVAGIAPGQRVLDVACGTGALTLAAARRLGQDGAVFGLDPNPDMLSMARRKSAQVKWREGRAERMPYHDGDFDVVVSQFGFMFFEDRVLALREMMRVLRPGGRLAVAVCDALEHSAGYARLARLLQDLFSREVADAFRAPFTCGDPALLRSLCEQAGIADAQVSQRAGTVSFASIAALVSTERACVWTLGGLLDDAQFERLLAACERELQPFAGPDGEVVFDMPALVITATKP